MHSTAENFTTQSVCGLSPFAEIHFETPFYVSQPENENGLDIFFPTNSHGLTPLKLLFCLCLGNRFCLFFFFFHQKRFHLISWNNVVVVGWLTCHPFVFFFKSLSFELENQMWKNVHLKRHEQKQPELRKNAGCFNCIQVISNFYCFNTNKHASGGWDILRAAARVCESLCAFLGWLLRWNKITDQKTDSAWHGYV